MIDDSHHTAVPRTVSTWHHGLVARWWAEIDNTADPAELAFFGSAVQEFGQPALDLGCGTGRLLVPFRQEGVDVDGCDVSPDMIGHCRAALDERGLDAGLSVQAMHRLNLSRTYRTIYLRGAFGLGSTQGEDAETLWRCLRHLKPGGGLVFDVTLPYSDPATWAAWTPQKHHALPEPWPDQGVRKPAANGEELEWFARTVDVDPLAQRTTLQTRVRLWRDNQMITEEEYTLTANEYFRNETLQLLDLAGFVDVRVTGGYSTRPPESRDPVLCFLARAPTVAGRTSRADRVGGDWRDPSSG